MAMLPKLRNFFVQSRAKYEVLTHKVVFTTYDAAQTLHVDLKTVGKTLFVKADSDFAFVIIPGNKRLDVNKLKKLINETRKKEAKKAGIKPKLAKKVVLTSETLIKKYVTKNAGALAPFGHLYKMVTYYDKGLDRAKKIILNAGSFTESVLMTPKEYKRLEKPVEGRFAK
jgi:Ala-tRNA(Pro) deacylase